MENLLTVDQISKTLQISKVYVYKLVREKKIPTIRIGSALRFDPSAIQAWLQKSTKNLDCAESEGGTPCSSGKGANVNN